MARPRPPIGLDPALLLLRLTGGGFLLPHGLGKLFGWFGGPGLRGFAGELQHFGLPSAMPLPLLLAVIQVGAGLAVLLGAWTRAGAALAAAFIATTVLLNLPNGWFWMHGGVEYPLLWLACLLALVFAGGGRWSLDGARQRSR